MHPQLIAGVADHQWQFCTLDRLTAVLRPHFRFRKAATDDDEET